MLAKQSKTPRQRTKKAKPAPEPPKAFEPACKRTGRCCETLPLDYSPRQLRESYDAWANNRSSGTIIKLTDIHLVLPMLAGKCRGKQIVYGHVKFIYGPCKNLIHEEVDGVEVASCSIHEIRPQICQGYPFYATTHDMKVGMQLPVLNPGYMKGCGYNTDPSAGKTIEEFNAELLPLDENEK